MRSLSADCCAKPLRVYPLQKGICTAEIAEIAEFMRRFARKKAFRYLSGLRDLGGKKLIVGQAYEAADRFRNARVRSHARLAAAWLYACGRSGSKNQCPVSL